MKFGILPAVASAAAGTALVTMIAVGCSSGGAVSSLAPDRGQPVGGESASVLDDEPKLTGDDIEQLTRTADDVERINIEYALMFDDLVGRCMRDQGWEYAPVVQQEFTEFVIDSTPSLAWITENGLGKTTSVQAVVEQYNAEASSVDATDPESDVALGKCQADSTLELGPHPSQLLLSPSASEVFADIDVRVKSNPLYVEARDSWQRCMAEAGHGFDSRDDMFEHFGRLADSYAQPFFERLNQLLSAERRTEAYSLTMSDVLEPADLDRYQSDVDQEIVVAIDDFDCIGVAQAIYDELYVELLSDYLGEPVSGDS